jgi:adenine deaminase
MGFLQNRRFVIAGSTRNPMIRGFRVKRGMTEQSFATDDHDASVTPKNETKKRIVYNKRSQKRS